MIQKHIVISMIAPVTVAGILMLAILAAISSTNQAFAYSSYHKAYYKGHHGYYKSSKYTKRERNIRGSESVTTGNEAQGTSNTGNEAQGTSNTGNEAQGTSNTGNEAQGTSNTGNEAQGTSNTGNEAQGTSNTGNEAQGTSNTGNEAQGTSNGATSQKSSNTPTIQLKCTTGYIWYPKPAGGRHCALGAMVTAPQGSSNTHPSARSSNSGNTAQESSNTGNEAQGTSNTGTIQLKCTTGYIWYPKPAGGFRHCALGAMVTAPQGSSNTHPGLKTES
jgi:hypothetical protein